MIPDTGRITRAQAATLYRQQLAKPPRPPRSIEDPEAGDRLRPTRSINEDEQARLVTALVNALDPFGRAGVSRRHLAHTVASVAIDLDRQGVVDACWAAVEAVQAEKRDQAAGHRLRSGWTPARG